MSSPQTQSKRAQPASLKRMNDKISTLRGDMNSRSKASSGVRFDKRDQRDGDSEDRRTQLRIGTLEKDLQRRQESYIRRERDYQATINRLQEELSNVKSGKSSWLNEYQPMKHARGMQAKILQNIEHVQARTTRILQEQERDLLRAFRARLFDVQTELEKEKSKADDGASVWIEKNRQLEKDLDWAKEMADRLERVNQSLGKENRRLKAQFSSQEDDREFLIRQLVAVKKDNARLRQEVEEKQAQLTAAEDNAAAAAAASSSSAAASNLIAMQRMAGQQQQQTSGFNASTVSAEAETRYKQTIARLKKLLEVERKNLRTVRTQYTGELQGRTELELFLRQCVQDVKQEISRRRLALLRQNSSPSHGGGGDRDPALSDLSAGDRERVMELLLSQERVISLLYSKTFPTRRSQDLPSYTDEDLAALYGGDGTGGAVPSPGTAALPSGGNNNSHHDDSRHFSSTSLSQLPPASSSRSLNRHGSDNNDGSGSTIETLPQIRPTSASRR